VLSEDQQPTLLERRHKRPRTTHTISPFHLQSVETVVRW